MIGAMYLDFSINSSNTAFRFSGCFQSY